MDANQVTALILTRDEERNLPRAMTSLPHGMHAFVLDAYSDDHTVEFARSAGAEVESREWTNFVDARRYALSRITTPWVLLIDADEALDDVLCQAILSADGDVDGYIVRRTTYFRGKPMRMWSNEPLLRLARRDRVRVEPLPATGGSSALHERLVCDGPVAELPGMLLHYSYSDGAEYREKFDAYTSIEAKGLSRDPGRFLIETLLVPLRLGKNLLAKGALLDGPRGWYVAWYSALYPAVVSWKAVRG
ncbi:MAG: glycosyltransferase family 2 protein [Candidatus Eremiobacteraeota bacterium]|nr:glycosyltransferase family 2 protein [Candidatus Eremiobacteraeota bacterium]